MSVRIINLSEMVEANGNTVRENNLAVGHKIPIGSLVEVKYERWHGGGACEKVHARLWVIEHARDCDGSPLYTLARTPREEWHQPTVEEWQRVPALSHPGLAGVAFHHPKCGFSEDRLTIVEATDAIRRGESVLTWEDE